MSTSAATVRRPRAFRATAGAFPAALAIALVPVGAASAKTSTPPAPRTVAGLDLDTATIPQLHAAMRAGKLSSVQLTQTYLNRIKAYDGNFDAVLGVNPKALREAAASDRQRGRGGKLRPLEGIPVLLKDNVDTTAQGATAGSRALLRSRPDDATIVKRLHAAGAVVLGKANLSEWANFRSENSSSGWSAVGGVTRNAYDPALSACGSSSGSATAVALSFSQVSIGTETNGSIVCPAAANGTVGIKPTVGLVSRDGIVPISSEQDTAGPIARNTLDAAITLAALQGKDKADDATNEIPASTPRDYTTALSADALRGKRIGVWRLETGSPAADRSTNAAVATLTKAGATVVDVMLPHQDTVGTNGYEALKIEFKRDLEQYLRSTPGPHPKSLAGLIEFNKVDEVELKYFDQGIFEMAQAAPAAGSAQHRALRESATSAARRSIDETLKAHDLDAIMAPTNSPAWPINLGEGDAFLFGTSGPAAVAGYPNVTVPSTMEQGLPIGMSFFGARFDEQGLLAIAAGFERAAAGRTTPSPSPDQG